MAMHIQEIRKNSAHKMQRNRVLDSDSVSLTITTRMEAKAKKKKIMDNIIIIVFDINN